MLEDSEGHMKGNMKLKNIEFQQEHRHIESCSKTMFSGSRCWFSRVQELSTGSIHQRPCQGNKVGMLVKGCPGLACLEQLG
jgi:hypothetical protein